MCSRNDANDAGGPYPYHCDITIALSTPEMAVNVQRILSVDRELGDRVVKTLSTHEAELHVQFRATEARWLRVSVSSFYEYLLVCLKCYQEFGPTLADTKDEAEA